jgi:hypothetical protein
MAIQTPIRMRVRLIWQCAYVLILIWSLYDVWAFFHQGLLIVSSIYALVALFMLYVVVLSQTTAEADQEQLVISRPPYGPVPHALG